MALEPLVRRRSDDGDESLASFVRRRLGQEVLERVAQPLIGGIYASDPETLSLAATMPRFPEMERNHGSVILGSRRAQKRRAQAADETGARWSLFVSIDGGMEVLVRRIEEALGPGVVRLGETVRELSWDPDGRRWRVDTNGAGLEADAVICTLPAFAAAGALTALDPELAGELRAIPFSSTATVNLAYRRSDIAHPLDGYGFVVPHVERRKIMACTFSSVKYAGRAPEDVALLRCFAGGALQARPAGSAGRGPGSPGPGGSGSAPRHIRPTDALPHHPLPRLHAPVQCRPSETALRGSTRGSGGSPPSPWPAKAYRGVGIADCILGGEAAAEGMVEHLSQGA